MELKPGYKQTEVGVIPADWEIEPLGSVGHWFSGGTPSMANDLYWSGEIPWVSAKDMKVARLRDSLLHVTEKAIGSGTRLAPPDAVLMVVRGMILAHSLPVAVATRSVAFNQDMKALVARAGIDSEFILLWLQSNAQRVLAIASEATHGTKRIPSEDLFSMRIALPPSAEQRAIAGALSDVDALIGALEQLIAKKRDLKQATMQQLLTGQTRLTGFSGEWESVQFADIADKSIPWSIGGGPFGSNLKASDYTDEGVRIIQLQNIGDGRFHNDYAIHTSEAKADELLSNNIYPGEIILSKMGDPVARACFVPTMDRRYLMASDGIRLAVDSRRFNNRFVHDFINSVYFRKKAIEASTGSTRQRIGLVDLKKLPFVAPSLPEQSAIAEVLSDMDAELAALEQRRDKTHALKQGMMQELLTGRIRLLKPEAGSSSC